MTSLPFTRRARLALPMLVVLSLLAFLGASIFRHYDRLTIEPAGVALPADGREHPLFEIRRRFSLPLSTGELRVSGPGVRVTQVDGHTLVGLMQTPVNPGEVQVHVSWRNQSSTIPVSLVPDGTDTYSDGMPDFLRLHSPEDRQAFRGWFTALADVQATLPPEKLPAEIDDCAALLRYAYREALRKHDDRWFAEKSPGEIPLLPSVGQYVYPQTPLASSLFRITPGPYRPADWSSGGFAQFADARTLMLHNTYLISRDVRTALRGDLIFYRQLEQNSPYHSMIITGPEADWVVYHTGPIGVIKGEMRRISVKDLLQYPDPRWRPVAANSNFLGVYRWNILRDAN